MNDLVNRFEEVKYKESRHSLVYLLFYYFSTLHSKIRHVCVCLTSVVKSKIFNTKYLCFIVKGQIMITNSIKLLNELDL